VRRYISAAIISVLFAASASVANDGVVIGEGGRVAFLEGEHKSVRMVRESVRMDVFSDYYVVRAEFVLKNDGDAVDVKMGFPESGGGAIRSMDAKTESGFRRFDTKVDGKPVNAIRKLAAFSTMSSYEAFWVKEVHFAKNQTRTVLVSYRSPPGMANTEKRSKKSLSTTIGYGAAYPFTGGNWRGKVSESKLVIVSHLPKYYEVTTQPKLRRVGNCYYFRKTDWQAQARVSLDYVDSRKWDRTPID